MRSLPWRPQDPNIASTQVSSRIQYYVISGHHFQNKAYIYERAISQRYSRKVPTLD